jgi:hypothetical protein
LTTKTFSKSYLKLHQDVIRFLYERGKLLAAQERPEFAPLEPQALDPYPGRLLREDVAAAERRAREALPRYFEIAQKWPRLLEALSRDRVLRDHWRSRFAAD